MALNLSAFQTKSSGLNLSAFSGVETKPTPIDFSQYRDVTPQPLSFPDTSLSAGQPDIIQKITQSLPQKLQQPFESLITPIKEGLFGSAQSKEAARRANELGLPTPFARGFMPIFGRTQTDMIEHLSSKLEAQGIPSERASALAFNDVFSRGHAVPSATGQVSPQEAVRLQAERQLQALSPTPQEKKTIALARLGQSVGGAIDVAQVFPFGTIASKFSSVAKALSEANLLSHAAQLTRADLIEITAGRMTAQTHPEKFSAYTTMSGDSALRSQLMDIAKNKDVPLTDKISRFFKDLFPAKTAETTAPKLLDTSAFKTPTTIPKELQPVGTEGQKPDVSFLPSRFQGEGERAIQFVEEQLKMAKSQESAVLNDRIKNSFNRLYSAFGKKASEIESTLGYSGRTPAQVKALKSEADALRKFGLDISGYAKKSLASKPPTTPKPQATLATEVQKYKSAEEFVKAKYNSRDLDYPKMDLALDKIRANPQNKVEYVEGFPGSTIQGFDGVIIDSSGKSRLFTSMKQLNEIADDIGVSNNTLWNLEKGATKAPFVGIKNYELTKTNIEKLQNIGIDNLPDEIAGIKLSNKAGFQQALDDIVNGRLSKTTEPIEIKDGELIQGYHRFVEKLQTGGKIKANEFSDKSQLTDFYNKVKAEKGLTNEGGLLVDEGRIHAPFQGGKAEKRRASGFDAYFQANQATRLIELAGGDQRLAYRAVKNAYDLTEAELSKLRGGEGMSKQEFEDFIKNLAGIVEKNVEVKQALARLEATIAEKNLTKWDNVREAMDFPPVSKMTIEQFDKLNEILSQYKTGDEFLPVRQLETIERTELTGLRTVREVQEHLAKKYNLTPQQLPGIKPHPWMYDAQLARQHPLYDLLIDRYNVSYLNASSRIIELEKENSALIKVARASRPQGIGGKIAPVDKQITEWLEAGQDTRTELANNMTGAELKATQRMDEVFHEYYDWLSKRSLEGKFESRFEDKYFPHVRRGFLEAWKEDGFLKGLKEQFDQFKQEERMLTILDQKTGDILPYEKWIGFSQFRTGGLVPTQNAARAFKTYITSLEKARQFDEFIPEIMIYVHSLTPKGLTARGVELDDSLKRFVKTWINSKKGRVQHQIMKPGSRMDWALRMGVALTRIRDLGVNIPVGIANIFGEQVTNLTMLGAKNYSLGATRLATSKGRAITKQYENFVGRTLWDKLGEASNTLGDQFLGVIYGLFGAASRRGNQIFLLGNMTTDEFAKGAISVERLAQLRKGMGKYRVVEGAESIFGKSVEGAIGGQYKKWAIPILVSTASNAKILAQALRTKGLGALKSAEGAELFYTVVVGSTIGLGTMGYYQELKDKKDRNFIEDIIFKSTRDALSLIGALDPKFIGSFAAPRLASFITDLTEAIDNLLFLEKYKNGDLKGVKQLERVLTPSVITQIIGKDETGTSTNGIKIPGIKIPGIKIPAIKI